jgi:hypothetical protein
MSLSSSPTPVHVTDGAADLDCSWYSVYAGGTRLPSRTRSWYGIVLRKGLDVPYIVSTLEYWRANVS